MNAQHDIDPEILQLVSRVDPLADAPAEEADTEASLRALAPRLDGPHPQRRGGRRAAWRIGLIAAGACGVAAAALVLTSTTGTVAPARAATIIRAAHAALLYPPGGILEEGWITRDGSKISSAYHQWTSTTPPYDHMRAISRVAGRPTWEQEKFRGRDDYYDPTTNTIYMQAPPSYRFRPGPTRHTRLLTVRKAAYVPFCPGPMPAADKGMVTLTVTTAQARALRRGTAQVVYDDVGHPDNLGTDPTIESTLPMASVNPNVESSVATVRFMLRQRGVTVDPNVTLGGMPAVKIASADHRVVYWAARGSYRPLQVVSRYRGRTSTTLYTVYRVLRGAAASPRLLSLKAQHPGATVDRNGDDYVRAVCRLGVG